MVLAQERLDRLWDFSDPAGSEERLRAAADAEPDAAVHAELATQVVRAMGLQERFDEAHVLLDGVSHPGAAVTTRVGLERGRLRLSAGEPEPAVPLFRAAVDSAASASLVFLQVDALHMLAIADAERAEAWTAEALRVLDGVSDARTLRWTVSLHSNAGWMLLDAGRAAEAVTAFENARDAARQWGTAEQRQWAEEALAEARAAL
ncbi:hypothetical protein [Microbacterium hominis]|uniref:Tetratricopeptide repeat protein n=1 Tax=Microbacterium hominis TaxID=162426 RepID=A0A7D4TFL5_9MICO|nr:hypothetical protein [Microbacterium hominis]QKJ18641.1 hypothetical protein HQM25_04065 [Microbacterium hominis]